MLQSLTLDNVEPDTADTSNQNSLSAAEPMATVTLRIVAS